MFADNNIPEDTGFGILGLVSSISRRKTKREEQASAVAEEKARAKAGLPPLRVRSGKDVKHPITRGWYNLYYDSPLWAKVRARYSWNTWQFAILNRHAANIADSQKSKTAKLKGMVKQSLTQPLKSLESHIKADILLLKGEGSKSRKVRRQAFEQMGAGISASLEPLKQLEIAAKKLVPEKYRKYTVGPAEVLEMATRPEEFAKKLYENLRKMSARPIYHLAGKTFGYSNAAYLIPFDVKASDLGIKEGTPEAAKFYENSTQGSNAAMTVVGTIYPWVGAAWAAYMTAKTVDEQREAKKLLDKSLKQSEIQFALEQRKRGAIMAGQKRELKQLEAQLDALDAQQSVTNSEIEVVAERSGISTPKNKAIMTVGAVGALAAAVALSQ